MKTLERLKVLLSLEDRFSGPLGGVEKRMRQATDRINRAAGQVGRGLLMGAGAGAGVFAMVAPAYQFESALGEIALTGNGAAKTLDGMRRSALRLTAELGGGSANMVRTLDEARRLTGLVGADLERATRSGSIMARQFHLEQTDIFKAQAALMREYGGGVDEATDAIAGLLLRGGDLKGELLEGISEYSVQFKQLGFDMASQVAVTQAALERGWNVDKALDAMKEGGQKLREQGITDVQGAMKAIGAEIAGLSNNTEKYNALKAVFGTPAGDVGVEGMLAMLGAIGKDPKVKGAMDDLTSLWAKSPAALWARFTGTIESLSVAFGSLLLPVLLPVFETFTNWLGVLRAWANRFQNIAKLVGLLALGVFALVGAFALLNIVAGLFGIISTGASLAFGILTALFGVFAAIAGVIFSPVILSLFLVGGAIVLAYVYWDELKTAVGTGVDWMGEKILALGGWFAGIWENLKTGFGAAMDWIAGRWEGFTSSVASLFAPGTVLGRVLELFKLESGTAPSSGATQAPGQVTAPKIPGAAAALSGASDGKGSVNHNWFVTTEKLDAGSFERNLGMAVP